MSVSRQLNLLGQQRVDIPHFRSLESSISNDFDLAMGTIVAGQKPLIVKGFNISMTNVIGKAASALVLNAANGVVIHYFASEAGSILSVSAAQAADILTSTNPNVSGAFVSNNTNYVGIDFLRATDPTTTDTVQFLDATSLVETAKSVPLSRALTYKIVISTNSFSSASNICPIAKVVTDINGNVTSIVDSRKMMFRLGSGGDFPNIQNTYSFPAGRSENTLTSSDVFLGGDKSIGNLKDWCDSVTTRLWEVSGGGDYWYSPTSPQNVQMIKEGAALANGDYFSYSGAGGANGDLTWQGIRILFSNAVASGVYYNIVTNQTVASPGLTNLAIGECVYVDLTRVSNATLTVTKTALTALGSPVIPGSRYIMAYRGPSGYVYARNNYLPVNSTNPFAAIPAATTLANGTVTLSATPASAPSPVVATLDSSGFAQATGLIRSASLAAGVGPLTIMGNVATSGTAVANVIDNSTNLTTAGDKVLSIRNAGVEKLNVDYTGVLTSGSIIATGAGAGTGVVGTGGTTSGDGLKGIGGAPNGVGTEGLGTGTGPGIKGTGGLTGPGVNGIGGGTTGVGVVGTGGSVSGDGVQGFSNGLANFGGNFTGAASSSAAQGGSALAGTGGSNSSTGNGGTGLFGSGGATVTGSSGGNGGSFQGGNSTGATTNTGGSGVFAFGGNATGAAVGNNGGAGITSTGGTNVGNSGVGVGGPGGNFTGGINTAPNGGGSGPGVIATGAMNNGGGAGNGVTAIGGAGNSYNSGHGIRATAGNPNSGGSGCGGVFSSYIASINPNLRGAINLVAQTNSFVGAGAGCVAGDIAWNGTSFLFCTTTGTWVALTLP